MLTTAGANISVLGSTGSIGVNCLDVVANFPDRFNVVGLTAGRNISLLADQIRAFRPKLAAVLHDDEAEKLKDMIDPGNPVEIIHGPKGFQEVATLDEVRTVVSAMVGAAGLPPTHAAIKAGKRVALANKETLVMAGELIMAEARASGAEILPVDSEHSAIFQALVGQRVEDVKRLVLTASGGPFRDSDPCELPDVTPLQALAHPQWKMGARVSIDSATLMNKGLEAIEARWLFGLPWDQIDILIHPQSIVHSMVEFVDGSILAQLGITDMRIPIAYALSYPERLPLDLAPLDLRRDGPLTFREPDLESFPCLATALEAGRRGGVAPSVLNAADEVAVQAFLEENISFMDIHRVVAHTLDGVGTSTRKKPLDSIDQVFEADQAAREKAMNFIKELQGATE